MGKERKYIHNLARSMMGEVGIDLKKLNPDLAKKDPQEMAKAFRGSCSMLITGKLEKMKPEALGRIAAFGLASPEDGNNDASKTTLSQVYERDCCGNPHLYPEFSGKRLLRMIAYYAIMAEIVDIIKAHFANAPSTTE